MDERPTRDAGTHPAPRDVTHPSAEERLRGVIDSLLDPWVLFAAIRDETGTIVDFRYADANDAACIANGLDRAQLLETTLLTLFPAHTNSGLLAAYAAVVESGRPLVLDDHPYRNELMGGELRYFDNRAVRVGDGISFTWRDVTERVEHRDRLARQARQDPLTGLGNREHLHEVITRLFGLTPRTGTRVAVFYCDVDDLKAINDTLGHHAGDQVLRAIADRIAGAVRSDDVVARVGGDEFVIVAAGVQDFEAAEALRAKVEAAVARPLPVNGEDVSPSISVGYTLTEAQDDPDAALRAADRDLYARKSLRAAATSASRPS